MLKPNRRSIFLLTLLALFGAWPWSAAFGQEPEVRYLYLKALTHEVPVDPASVGYIAEDGGLFNALMEEIRAGYDQWANTQGGEATPAGFIATTAFLPATWADDFASFDESERQEAALSARALLAAIVDVRSKPTIGGKPDPVAFLTSYLVAPAPMGSNGPLARLEYAIKNLILPAYLAHRVVSYNDQPLTDVSLLTLIPDDIVREEGPRQFAVTMLVGYLVNVLRRIGQGADLVYEIECLLDFLMMQEGGPTAPAEATISDWQQRCFYELINELHNWRRDKNARGPIKEFLRRQLGSNLPENFRDHLRGLLETPDAWDYRMPVPAEYSPQRLLLSVITRQIKDGGTSAFAESLTNLISLILDTSNFYIRGSALRLLMICATDPERLETISDRINGLSPASNPNATTLQAIWERRADITKYGSRPGHLVFITELLAASPSLTVERFGLSSSMGASAPLTWQLNPSGNANLAQLGKAVHAQFLASLRK